MYTSTREPFFSVIIPTYNRLPYLKLALNSVLRQDFQNFEVIIVDDGSTDDTLVWTQELQKTEPRLRVLHQPNQGVSTARNTGIQTAIAPWIALLDSDDQWMPEKLSVCHDFILNRQSHPILHSDEVWLREDRIVKQKLKRPSGDAFAECVKQCCIGPSTSVLHRSVFAHVGLFRCDLPVCEDYDFWLRATSRFMVTHIPLALIQKHGGHEDQLSTRFHSMDFWRLKALVFQLWNPFLTSDKKALVAETMIQKSEILLKGYEKHHNLENKNTVLELKKQAQDSLYHTQTYSELTHRHHENRS